MSGVVTAAIVAALIILLGLSLWHIATKRPMHPAFQYLTLAIVAFGAVWHQLVLA